LAKLLLPALVAITFISHAFHMFQYPLYLGDEGIYMEQAWTVLQGRGLTPYTYFYDHAPAGWILIAAWLRLLPHGVYQWGMAINSGRVLMLLLNVTSSVLLYRLARRFTGSAAAAFLAGAIFALSPLSLYYGRQVLLDNIMVFWLMVTLELLTGEQNLYRLFGAAAAFGMAVLTKENVIFFAPVLAVALYTGARDQPHYRFGLWGWLFSAFSVISLYPVYALLKGEFFGTDAFLVSAQGGHVNLLGGLEWQLSRRVQDGSIFNYPHGEFWDYYFGKWAAKDQIILIFGGLAIMFNLVVGLLRRELRRAYLIAAGLSICFAVYLVRGAVLLEFYIVPLLPFLALNIALALHLVLRPLPRVVLPPTLVAVALALGYLFTQVEHSGRDAFLVPQTPLQEAQLAFVREHIPTNAIIEIDDDLWVDLHDSGGGAYPVYPYADPHYKIAGDPAVRDRKDGIDRRWQNIDFVVASNRLLAILQSDTTDRYHVALDAYRHSTAIWTGRLGQVMVEVRKVQP
jgi:4-amino-4-deoxy-L-arabinose transferase-like glycosyltransferase